MTDTTTPGERIEVQFPPEPPVGSVVIDSDGRAWQHRIDPYGPWIRATSFTEGSPTGSNWPNLLASGALTLVWRGPEPTDTTSRPQ